MHTILVGDVREQLKTLPDNSIQCCVTSPPYWGLRDYGHDGQIGLEKTPEAYVAQMVAVFREVRRVLRDDGTLWLNLGDSYARNGGGVESKMNTVHKMKVGQKATYLAGAIQTINTVPEGFKSKDLVGIPWRVAFALQADGWWLRQDIIWHKPNPMPESVTDRCTKAHEYVFLMTKSSRYFFDQEGMQEAAVGGSKGAAASFKRSGSKRGIADVCPSSPMPTHRADREDVRYDGPTRNRRSVWSIATRSYRGAHFAVMPEALVEPCLLAGSKPNDTMLDPFLGSGTTLAVAKRLGRNGIGIELNPEYVTLAKNRIGDATTPLF